MRKELYLLFLILILTIFSLIVFPGYKVFVYDQSVYIPGIYQTLNGLLQNDFLSNFDINVYTLFDELIIFFIKFLNMDLFSSFFFLSIIVRFIYFYSIYRISFYFTNNEQLSIFSMLLFIISKPVYGTAAWTWDINILPRDISLSFNLLFLAYFLNGRRLLSTLPLGIGLLTHPITSSSFIIFFYADLFFPPGKKRFSSISLLLGAVPFLFLIFHLLNTESGLKIAGTVDPLWESIIVDKTPFVFISTWNYKHFLSLFVDICFFVFINLESSGIFDNKVKKRYFVLFFLIPLGLFISSFIAVDIFKIHFFMQLPLTRGLTLWKIFIPLLFLCYAYRYIMTYPTDVIYNFFLIGIILSFIFCDACIFVFLPILFFLWIKRKYNLFSLTKVEDRLFVVIFCILTVVVLVRYILKNNYESFLYLGSIVLFSIIASLVSTQKKDFIFGYKLIGGLVILMVVCIVIFGPKFSIYPPYFEDKKFIEACNWITTNTPEKAIFITEPFSKYSIPIRVKCYRNIFVSGTDGGLAYYKRDYALEWGKRMALLYKLKNPNFLSEILKEYKVDYVFSEHKLCMNYPLVFDNTKYFIYKLS